MLQTFLFENKTLSWLQISVSWVGNSRIIGRFLLRGMSKFSIEEGFCCFLLTEAYQSDPLKKLIVGRCIMKARDLSCKEWGTITNFTMPIKTTFQVVRRFIFFVETNPFCTENSWDWMLQNYRYLNIGFFFSERPNFCSHNEDP